MRSHGVLPLLLLCASGTAAEEPVPSAITVSFAAGEQTLHGLLYRPSGAGPFGALLYNHGSAPGLLSNAAFELIAPELVAHGWVFFAPYRRGQGLSAQAGRYVGDEIAAARQRGGEELARRTLVRLLAGEQLHDQLAALAWLRSQRFVRPQQVAVMGNSFGGIEALLGA